MRKRLPFGVTMAVLAGLVFLAMLVSMAAGQMTIPFDHVLRVLGEAAGLGTVPAPAEETAVVWNIRLPRTLVGLLVGGGLALAGATLQGIFQNPLADPGMLGVSAGASVGAVLAIATGAAGAALYALPLFAVCGALGAIALTIALSMRRGGHIPVLTLLLAGVVVSMLLAAVTAAVLTAVNEQKMQAYLFWTVGGLDYRRWAHVLLALPPFLVCAVLLLLFSRQLNILSLGETEARALGMRVTAWRVGLLMLASCLTASGVAVSGNIGFVGLVVPHAMRMLVGPDHRRLLPASMLAGAAFLVLCDSLGRVLGPSEIRVGIMTAFVGTPYFLYLLRKQDF